jgi:phosphoglycolate phosphatase
MAEIRTVLFDLDGTLADTAPDLGFALNTLLEEHRRAPLPHAQIRAEASHGARALIKLGFGLAPTDAGFEPLRDRFLQLYRQNICTHTVLFPGMAALLDAIIKRGLRWGVVTNKPAALTDALIARLPHCDTAACVVSGDTTANNKPHPEPILYACTQTGSRPEECLFVGDADRDIEAGRRAGAKTLVALFGYLRPHDEPRIWGADGLVASPAEILTWVERHNREAAA